MKLLVVEDEAEIADALATFGREREFEVFTAFDGAEAIEVADRERPDVILLDINLPGVDGRDVMAQLNRLGVTSNAVVLFVTGRDSQSDRLVGLELGADDYETKPLHFGRLFRKIDRLVQKKRSKSR